MTREEITNSRAYQATKAALEYYNEHHQDKDIDLTDAFAAGAKWADKTMIEKICDWLKDQLVDNQDNCGYAVVSTFDTTTVEEFICDFKKAMEL